jgi:hypothetical protein
MPTSASGCWRVVTQVTGETCVDLSKRTAQGWGTGERWNFLYKFKLQTESQRPHIKKIWTKMKNYGQG